MISTRSLAQQMNLPDDEIESRKRLLGLDRAHLDILARCEPLVLPQIDAIIEEFYDLQVAIPEFRDAIGDCATLDRLKETMHAYVARVFGGDYGADYVESRQRVGRIHARIGVAPKLYVAALHQLVEILAARLAPHCPDPLLRTAIEKIFLFDLVLAFDTYIQGLVDQVSQARDDLAAYVRNLERLVEERTASLKKLAETDDLTGLKNRRALMAALSDRISRPGGPREPFGFAFLDINRFKEVNDTHGHVAGDRVLRKVAAAFQASVPEPENVFRYGGDEFVAVFPVSATSTAPEVARILKARIESRLHGAISVSVGVTHVAPGEAVSLEQVLRVIDREMYRNKPGKPGAAQQLIA